MDNILFLLNILRQSLIGQREKNKHSTILFGNRKQPLHFFLLHGDGIDQGTPRIDPKCRLDHLNITGINRKWGVR